ncbi:hypothetical protein Avbf_18677 [Armadillidium vulgare]|nr:hypothetical protein Avbf_18677 [Armadillidium vulgare]
MYFEYVDSYEFLKDEDDPDELRRNQWKTRIHEQMVSLSSKATPHSGAPTSDERERIAKCRSISRRNPALLGTTELESKQRKTHRRSLSLVSHVPESRKSVRGIAQPRSVREQYADPDKSDDINSHDRTRSVNTSRAAKMPKTRRKVARIGKSAWKQTRSSDALLKEYMSRRKASVRNPQLIDLSLNNKKDKTQSIEIVGHNPGEEPKEAARDKIIKDKNEHSAQQRVKRVPKEVVKAQELSLISENDYCLSGKEKRIPKKVVKTQELSLISENEHSLQSKGRKSPREGQLLVTEANNEVREDGCIFVRSVLSTVKHGRVLIEVLNLGRKDVKLGKGEKITRVFEVEYLPTRSIQESPMDVNNMHRKNVRKKGVDDRRKREVINATRETLMKKIHEDGKRQARQNGAKKEIPTKSSRLTPRQLRETYRAILTKTSREGSVLRNRNELERMIDFLIRNRDIVGLADDPIGKYPGYEFKLELEPDCPKVLYTQQYKQPRVYQEGIKQWTEKQLKEGLIEPSVSPFSSPLLVVPRKTRTIEGSVTIDW